MGKSKYPPTKAESLVANQRGIMEKNRKYLPTIAELIDRLSIIQLKEVFIPEHKEEYAEEIDDIVHDLDLLMNWEKPSC